MNWDLEIAALQDLTMTACESHRIVGALLINGMADAADQPDGPLLQKILMAKLAAETVSALEDLGGLAWAVRNRTNGAILDRYIAHKPEHARQIYRSVEAGGQMDAILKLPPDRVVSRLLVQEDLDAHKDGIAGLQRIFASAARSYCGTQVDIVKAYNKLKHGFVVIVRLDELMPGQTLETDWLNDVNIVTGIETNGEINYVALERSQEMADALINMISMCANAAKELAYLMMFLWERHVPLEAAA
jgi:hypothetical protein